VFLIPLIHLKLICFNRTKKFWDFAFFFFFQAEDGIRDFHVTGVQTCALPISGQGRAGLLVARLRDVARERILLDRLDGRAGLLQRLDLVGKLAASGGQHRRAEACRDRGSAFHVGILLASRHRRGPGPASGDSDGGSASSGSGSSGSGSSGSGSDASGRSGSDSSGAGSRGSSSGALSRSDTS